MTSFRERVKNSKKPKYFRFEEEEDFIIGVVQGFRRITSAFGDCEVMDIINDEDKELYAVLCGTVIQSEREKQDIKVGERVGIKYLGEEGNYKNFIVMVERPGIKQGEENGKL